MNTVSRRITTGVLMSILMGLIIAVAVATAGCNTGPEIGTLRVIGSCSRAGTIEVFIDGARAGTIAGSGSADYPLPPGPHTVSARSSPFAWSPRTVTVSADAVFEFRLLC